ncbi:hypothetical protein Pla175_46160 [Pirellulimonas nuda]|uniref:Uncharacterized protein n=1 Tax=Pirellulimonas nuda TaxID=2528009 RepID=A0A518DI85_9BACT|nr:hypothetical protein [Pirellulimonas nuda]QDU91196.1 hypothetical protein Pla175_46160 [Pirellulimonas nuda]
MDQLKAAFAWLKKHHFWVLGAVAPLIAIACWWMGASELDKQFVANKGKIDGEFQSHQALSSKSFLPNDPVNNRQTQENDALAKRIEKLWTRLYDRQREVVLRWPAELGDDFVDEVQDLQFGDWIRDGLRQTYLNYIVNYFPNLRTIVGAQELADEDTLGGFGGGGGEYGGRGGGGEYGGGGFGGGSGGDYAAVDTEQLVDQDFIVYWVDQAAVKSTLVWDRQPSPLRVWVTQENLWVYETLLRAIAATNVASGADRNSNAAVQQILEMQVGPLAARESRATGRLYTPETASPLGGLGESEYGDSDGFAMDDPSGGGDMMSELGEGMGGDSEVTELLYGRYLDENGLPIEIVEPVEYPIGAEFKRLPVRLALYMDQRWVNQLILELANAPLQVEIQEVRINPGGSVGSGGGGGGGGGEYGGGGSGSPFANNTEDIQAFNRRPSVVPVVLQGIVYIFNQPDPAALKVQGDDSLDMAMLTEP